MLKKIAIISIALLAFMQVAVAAQFNATIEDDALMKAGDNDYAHGTGFELIDDNFMQYPLRDYK